MPETQTQSVEEMIEDMRGSIDGLFSVDEVCPTTANSFNTPLRPRFTIPRGYTLVDPSIETYPPDITGTDMVKVLMSHGKKFRKPARHFYWGRGRRDTYILAYKKLLDGVYEGWTAWADGIEGSHNTVPDIVLTNPTARVRVWLRGMASPQSETRQASHWNWSIDEDSSDIMRYRVVS